MSPFTSLPSLLLFLFLLFISGSQALSWTVRFRSYEANSCFYINVAEASQTISIYYNVQENKKSEIGHKVDYVIASPNGQTLMAEQGINYKDFPVQPIMAGRHSICFKHNGSPTEKVLDIDVTISKPLKNSSAGPNGKPGELIPVSPTAEVERVNRRVKEDLTTLFHSLKNMKDREKGNQNTVESIMKVMKWFSIFQVVSVIGIGYAHVYVLKTFFTNNARTRV